MSVTDPRRKSSMGFISRRILFGIAVVLAALGVAAVVVVPKVLEEDEPPVTSSADEVDASSEHFVNESGGYQFDHPGEWSVATRGSVTDVESPDDEAIVSFGIAPEGDLLVASDRLLELLRDSYRGFELQDEDIRSFGSDLGMVRDGTAINGTEPLRFRTVIIKTSEGNYAITAFATQNEGVRYMSDIERIMGSFDIAQ
jgi:hypothetical protein